MCTLGMFTTIGFAPPVHWSAPLSPPQGGSAGAAPDQPNKINEMSNKIKTIPRTTHIVKSPVCMLIKSIVVYRCLEGSE